MLKVKSVGLLQKGSPIFFVNLFCVVQRSRRNRFQ